MYDVIPILHKSMRETAEEPKHPETSNETLRILADCKELLDFATWAFSADGLPNLEVLAFGHFDGRLWNFPTTKAWGMLLRRHNSGYEFVENSKIENSTTVEDPRGFLNALQTDRHHPTLRDLEDYTLLE